MNLPFNRQGAERLARRLGIARDSFLGGWLFAPARPRPGRRKAARMRARGY